MIKKILKWTGLLLGAVLILLLAGYAFVAYNVHARIDKQYAFEPEQIPTSSDSALLLRGKHLVAIKGCQDCHGEDLGGKMMSDDGAVGRLAASNLTKGKGGLPGDYSSADWLTALRHGVNRAGKPLLFMPSHETTLLSEQDMSALISYCETIPEVDRVMPKNKVGPVALIMTYLGKMPLLSVEKIDHQKSMVAVADSTEGAAQGKYLAISCSGCHRENFRGGEPLAPGFPPVPDITSTGHVGKWTQEQFITTLTSGHTPEGAALRNEFMPWKMTAQYTKTELASLYQYLHALN